MGLLDDAIREHLELKRRRGADPSELERQEHEALGPVRRSPHESEDFVTDEEPPTGDYPLEEEGWDEELEEPVPFDHTAESELDAPTEFWPEPGISEAPDERPLHGYEPEEPPLRDYDPDPVPASEPKFDAPRHHEIAEEWEAHERQGSAAEPADIEPGSPPPGPPRPAAASGPVAPAPPDFDQETEEYYVEDGEPEESAGGEPAEREDMLEETPDFLQDTPDHDRLWFEQRPPKDFDFGN